MQEYFRLKNLKLEFPCNDNKVAKSMDEDDEKENE